MPVRFLDTNVLVGYFTRDDHRKAVAALALLRRVEGGDQKVATSPLVVFKTVFTLQKSYPTPRPIIRDALSDIRSLQGVELPQKSLYLWALDLYAELNVSFADAYNATYMHAQHVGEIYSWDADFNRIEGIVRIEPA
jgi:predicted nucleic acid-binding protein